MCVSMLAVSVCLSVCLSVRVSVCLCVCLSILCLFTSYKSQELMADGCHGNSSSWYRVLKDTQDKHRNTFQHEYLAPLRNNFTLVTTGHLLTHLPTYTHSLTHTLTHTPTTPHTHSLTHTTHKTRLPNKMVLLNKMLTTHTPTHLYSLSSDTYPPILNKMALLNKMVLLTFECSRHQICCLTLSLLPSSHCCLATGRSTV